MTAALPRLRALEAAYGLPHGAAEALDSVLVLLESEPASVTSVRDPAAAADVHVADSLVALELPAVRAARRIADLGAGGGFPGLALAAALPGAHVTLVESVGRKCEFMRRAAGAAGLVNTEVVHARAEEWVVGRGSCDLVTARALAPLNVLAEYAAPLLSAGGAMLAYKGRRDPDEEADAAAATELLGMAAVAIEPVTPFPGAGERHLYLYSKVRETPDRFPRRAGMARKRPLRAST